MNEVFTLRSQADGLNLSVMVVRPEGKPVAVLQLAHGMRGCKERFLPFMEYMAEHGVVCVANDHRGHGSSVRSPEDLGYMYKGGWRALVDDMKTVTDWVHSEYPDMPLYLLGHSMGSLAARAYVKDYDSKIDGLFICGSPSYNSLSVFGRFLTGIMGLWRGGRLRPVFLWTMASASYNRRFRDEGPMAWICSDPEVRKSFAANPHCNFIFTVNASHSLFCMMREAYSYSGWKVGNPNMMIYFISGTDDPCLINEKRFHHAAQHMAGRGYMNVTSALYPNMRHEVLNEIGKEAVWMDILEHINPTGRPNV